MLSHIEITVNADETEAVLGSILARAKALLAG